MKSESKWKNSAYTAGTSVGGRGEAGREVCPDQGWWDGSPLRFATEWLLGEFIPKHKDWCSQDLRSRRKPIPELTQNLAIVGPEAIECGHTIPLSLAVLFFNSLLLGCLVTESSAQRPPHTFILSRLHCHPPSRTSCDDGNVFYLHCPILATQQMRCGWWNLENDF